MVAMLAALLLISIGTGLFKGNLQVMVGNLYDDPKYAEKRDAGFSIFYMAINIVGGIVCGLLASFPLVGFVFSLLGGALGIYTLAGVILASLHFFGLLKI